MTKYIYHESLFETHNHFDITKVHQGNFLKYVVYKDLRNILYHAQQYKNAQHIFLLDESRFDYFKFSFSLDEKRDFTIKDFHKIVDEKLLLIKTSYAIDSEKLFYFLDNNSGETHSQSYVIGTSWPFTCDLCIVFIKKTTLNIFKAVYGKDFSQILKILPASFATHQFLKTHMKKNDYNLLYISEAYCKVIQIKSGFYHTVRTINLGINVLKNVYKDNSIVPFFYKDKEEIDKNQVAKDLVKESVDFYADLLSKWLFDTMGIGQDVFLISKIINNQYFIELFKTHYNKYVNGYVVPFHYAHGLNFFAKEWDPEDMDVLVYLNSIKLSDD